MDTTIIPIALWSEIIDQHHLYLVREQDEVAPLGEEREERLLDEARNMLVRLHDAETRQRA